MPRFRSMFDINKFCANNKCNTESANKPIETEANSQCHIYHGKASESKAMRYSQYIRTVKPCAWKTIGS